MVFHPGKCTTLPVTKKANKNNTDYELHGHTLETVQEAKYLGVTLTKDLTWNRHIDNVCAKANKTLGFLRRNLKIGSKTIKETAYKTFVRPILEYSSTVWDPESSVNINKLEAVQRRAARFTLNRYHNTSSVSAMIESLKWPSLRHRRKVSRLVMMKKILDNEAVVNRDNIIPAPSRNRRGHSQQLRQIQCKRDYRQQSFVPKTIKDWNSLPEATVASGTLETFKTRVQRQA